MASPNPITDFFKDFWNGLIGSGFYAGQQQTARNIGYDTARASGVDPATGKPIAPQYAASAAGIGDAEQKAANQYLTGFDQAFEANGGISLLPFSPVVGGDAKALDSFAALWPFGGSSGNGGSGFSGSSTLVVVLVVLVLAFVFVKVVK